MAEKRTLENPQPFDSIPSLSDITKLPNLGFYHSVQQLWSVYFNKNLKSSPVEFLADFASYMARGSLDQDWFKDYTKTTSFQFCKERAWVDAAAPSPIMNMIYIGDIAYIALNTTDNEFKYAACDALKEWRHNPYADINISERTLDNIQPFGERPSLEDIVSLPNMGQYHSTEKLAQVFGLPDIKKKSAQFLAEYSDYVTRGSLEQQWFVDMLVYDRNRIENCGFNVNDHITFAGNMAYASLNHSNPFCQEVAIDILDLWLDLKQLPSDLSFN